MASRVGRQYLTDAGMLAKMGGQMTRAVELEERRLRCEPVMKDIGTWPVLYVFSISCFFYIRLLCNVCRVRYVHW